MLTQVLTKTASHKFPSLVAPDTVLQALPDNARLAGFLDKIADFPPLLDDILEFADFPDRLLLE